MKALFVTLNSGQSIMSGVSQCSMQNYNGLCAVLGNENVTRYVLELPAPSALIAKIVFEIKRLFYIFKADNEVALMKKIQEYEVVFIDTASLGYLSKKIRQYGFQGNVIVFFHNCEYIFIKQVFEKHFFLLRWRALRWIKYNEKCALKYATTICLNNRDKDDIAKIYKKNIDYIIPISIKDKYKADLKKESPHVPPILTFIGSSFFANLHGIRWFINNVMPFVDIRLRIIGNGMKILDDEIIDKRIEVLSNVEDLSPYILESDFMVYPIFKGSGMKVKTCEALMYGKYIIGTKEVFEGYDVNYSDVGACCNTAEDFIRTIKELSLKKIGVYNEYSRSIYLEKYSFEASIPKYKKVIFNL